MSLQFRKLHFISQTLQNSFVTTTSQFSLNLLRLRVPVNVSILCRINDCVYICIYIYICIYMYIRTYSSCFMCAILAHMRLPFFKIFSNVVHFCQNFQTFCPFFPLFLKNHMHVLTFWNKACIYFIEYIF